MMRKVESFLKGMFLTLGIYQLGLALITSGNSFTHSMLALFGSMLSIGMFFVILDDEKDRN